MRSWIPLSSQPHGCLRAWFVGFPSVLSLLPPAPGPVYFQRGQFVVSRMQPGMYFLAVSQHIMKYQVLDR